MFLKTKDKKSPFIIMLNPNKNHFQFVALDLDNAATNHAANKPVDVFLVDSLAYSISDTKATKFLILAAIHFMRVDSDWMNDVVKQKGLCHRVSALESFPEHAVFLDELKTFKINIVSQSMAQANDFDCGIFCILQMNRLSRFLYGADGVSSFVGETLRQSHVHDCLAHTIKDVKPITQGNVDKWRTIEFFYLLSVWINHVSDMIKKAGGSLAGLNETLKTDFKNLTTIPYIGVKYQGKSYYIQAAKYAELELEVAKHEAKKTIKILELKNKKWWKHIEFISAPSASDLPPQLNIEFKKQTDIVQYVPSTADLCRFYPGHSKSFDKYIASDYIFWKLHLMDKRIVGHKNTCANVGLCINSFNVGKTTELFKKAVKSGAKKRERGEEAVDLLSDDE